LHAWICQRKPNQTADGAPLLRNSGSSVSAALVPRGYQKPLMIIFICPITILLHWLDHTSSMSTQPENDMPQRTEHSEPTDGKIVS